MNPRLCRRVAIVVIDCILLNISRKPRCSEYGAYLWRYTVHFAYLVKAFTAKKQTIWRSASLSWRITFLTLWQACIDAKFLTLGRYVEALCRQHRRLMKPHVERTSSFGSSNVLMCRSEDNQVSCGWQQQRSIFIAAAATNEDARNRKRPATIPLL